TDSQQYLLLANNLRQHRFFSWDGVTPVTFRTPGYPLLLALVGESRLALLIVQSLLGALTVLAVSVVGVNLFGERAGFIAAVLMASDLPSIAHTGLVMSETLFAFLVVLSLWAFFRSGVQIGTGARSSKDDFWLAGSGLLLGLAAMVRPVALFAWLPFGLALVAYRRWRGLVFMLSVFSLLPVLWTVRNYVHYRKVAFTSLGGYNLFYYNAAAMEADRLGLSFPEARVSMERSYADSLTGDNPLVLAEQLGREGLRRMLADPARYIKVYFWGLARIVMGIKSDEIVLRIFYKNVELATTERILGDVHLPLVAKAATVLLATLELLVTILAMIVAVVAALRRRDLVALLVAAGVYYLLAAAPLPDGRFRIPALPFFYLACASLLGCRVGASLGGAGTVDRIRTEPYTRI
ncbi:MAG: glycosyltransferase family 39 protein, partial [candidate division WOR-3 bacterium]